MCNYDFANTLLSLPQKDTEAKEQGRDMQTPIDDSSIFTEVSRSAQAFP